MENLDILLENMRPLFTFRIYAHHYGRKRNLSTLFFRVKVFPSFEEMQEYLKVEYDNVDTSDTADAFTLSRGIYRVYRDQRKTRKLPEIGEMIFHQSKMSSGTISHECFHATMAYLRRVKFDFSKLEKKNEDDDVITSEERAAYIQGVFVQQIVSHLIDRGL
jgi:hypothetical protein